jgi:hypothetical protein
MSLTKAWLKVKISDLAPLLIAKSQAIRSSFIVFPVPALPDITTNFCPIACAYIC